MENWLVAHKTGRTLLNNCTGLRCEMCARASYISTDSTIRIGINWFCMSRSETFCESEMSLQISFYKLSLSKLIVGTGYMTG